MKFCEILERVDRGEEVVPPASWAQGRATFGGLAAALVYRQMRRAVAAERPLRAMAVSFVGPIAPAPVELEAEVLREGRAVTQVEGRARQEDGVMTAMLASFGFGREARLRVEAEPAPAVPGPDDCPPTPTRPGAGPAFTRYFDYRWAIGGTPFSGSRSREMGGWIRFAEAPERLTEAHLLALVDAWPPAVFSLLSAPAIGSSLSWNIEFVQPLPELRGEEWLLYRATVDQAGNGYAHIDARLWTAGGELIALSRQTVTVFE